MPNRSGARRSARPGRPRRSRRRRAARPLEQGDDVRQRREARQQRLGRRAATTTSRSQASRQRRTSPAGSPPSAAAIAETSSRARSRVSARCGSGSRASAARICASSFGPTPGTLRSRPAAAASRSSSGVRTPSACAISIERFAVSPR